MHKNEEEKNIKVQEENQSSERSEKNAKFSHQKQRRRGRWMTQGSHTVLQAENKIYVLYKFMSIHLFLQMQKYVKSV